MSPFSQPTDDPTIHSDARTATIEGYYRFPAVWIGARPDAETVRVLNPQVHHEVVLAKKLNCGIEVRAQRDGTFLFDFSSWPLAPSILVPGYRREANKPIPKEHSNKREEAEKYSAIRAQVMNVHQACLATAQWQIKRSTHHMGFPVASCNTFKSISFSSDQLPYGDNTEDFVALARNVLNNKDGVPGSRHPLPRLVIELNVVERSFELLDYILATTSDIVLTQMVEGVYIATSRIYERRFGEAVTLAWSVCEQLISSAWVKLLDDTKTSGRLPKTRSGRLESPDYTASVRIEILEFTGRIDYPLYRDLEVIRKARNNWGHNMKLPTERDAILCVRVAESLLLQLKGISVSLHPASRSGVPSWWVWVWERMNPQSTQP